MKNIEANKRRIKGEKRREISYLLVSDRRRIQKIGIICHGDRFTWTVTHKT